MLWSERVEAALGIPAWDTEESTLILDMARDVAHGVDRRFAPLTAYAVGVAVGLAMAEDSGTPRPSLLSERLQQILRAVSEAEADAKQ